MMLKKYTVVVPIVGVAYFDVEAEDADSAINAARTQYANSAEPVELDYSLAFDSGDVNEREGA